MGTRNQPHGTTQLVGSYVRSEVLLAALRPDAEQGRAESALLGRVERHAGVVIVVTVPPPHDGQNYVLPGPVERVVY